jgi:hypothetical protein
MHESRRYLWRVKVRGKTLSALNFTLANTEQYAKASKISQEYQKTHVYLILTSRISICDPITTFSSCGHIGSRNVLTRTYDTPSTSVKKYKEANDPLPAVSRPAIHRPPFKHDDKRYTNNRNVDWLAKEQLQLGYSSTIYARYSARHRGSLDGQYFDRSNNFALPTL